MANSGRANRAGGDIDDMKDDTQTVVRDSQPPDATDNANYFSAYAYLYHQMDMLEDSHRTGQYYRAIMSNPESFRDKVVLDVGAGTCILSLMAAKAGARKVYAVEATEMAQRARKIVAANGQSDVIHVIQGMVETVELPSKVDVIISEWMGYLLLRESMLDSVLVARDRFLKPGGALFPSHATLFLAPLGSMKVLEEKWNTYEEDKLHFEKFASDMQREYDADFSCMREEFVEEQRKYYLQSNSFTNLTPRQLGGNAKPLLDIDLSTVQLADLSDTKEPLRCTCRIARDREIAGFCGFFDVKFLGSTQNPVEEEVTLTTRPTNGSTTHWGQQAFGFYPPLDARRGELLDFTVFVRRQEPNHRLLMLDTDIVLYALDDEERKVKARRKETYFIN